METAMSGVHIPKRTKLTKMRPGHAKFGQQDFLTGLDKSRKPRPKKETPSSKYEMLKKTGVPDYTDVAYRDAVSRLRYLLNESYLPPPPKYPVSGFGKQDESDEESGASPIVTDRTKATRLSPFRRPYFPQRLSKPLQPTVQSSQYYGEDDPDSGNQLSGSPELIAFIERQEEYIDQLEKEAQYCRDELSHLLGKVKELISENESLQDQQKTGLMKVMFEGVEDERSNDFHQSPKKYRTHLDGPLIVFESRISELEAQLTQSKIDLRKAQDEAETYKKKLQDSQPSSSNYDFYKQIENLQREKRDLNESLAKLQASISQIREKEMDASKKVQRTLDVVDKTQFEKQQAEMEVYRLKSELEMQHDKLLEVISEQTRKVADERSQAERRYQQHVERLNAELTMQRDSVSKLQMEIEKHQRIEEDLKRDLTAKNMTIENVKKELNNKIGSLQKELAAALAERDSIEQELNTSRMSSERVERLNKQESSRLQVEISALKKRLDGGDADLIHCRRENLRLLEKISDLEKDLTLYKIKLGEQRDPIEDEEQKAREKLMNSRISEIEAKHVEKVSDLEGLIENQSQVMAQLKAECQSLTQKLEESTARHKQEMENLQTRLITLNNKMDTNFGTPQWTDDTVKDLESPASERTRYQTSAEDKKIELPRESDGGYSQKFLNEESRQSSTSVFDTNYLLQNQTPKEQSYQSNSNSSINNNNNSNSNSHSGNNNNNNTDLAYGSTSGNGYEMSGNGVKQDSQNVYFDQGQGNDYTNYYANGHQPTSSYLDTQSPYQDQSSTLTQQQSSYQTQLPYTDQGMYQESQQQQQPVYLDQQPYQEQIGLADTTQVQEKVVVGDSQPVSVPPVEPLESVPPEPKPPPAEPPGPTATGGKTTPSQRFQRAAELSRQSSRSDDSSRGKLTTAQARARTSQGTRNATKSSSRFK